MSDTPAELAPTSNRIALIYGLFGPPVGGIFVWVYYWIERVVDEVLLYESIFEGVISIVGTIVGFALLGYPFGGIQALLTGLLIKAIAGPQGKFGYLTALIAPSIIGGVASVILCAGYIGALDNAPIEIAAFIAVIGIAASLALRFLFRKRFQRA